MIGGLTSPWHLLVVLVVTLLVFGPEKLPEIARQVGTVHRDFRRFQASLNNEVRSVFDPESMWSNGNGSTTPDPHRRAEGATPNPDPPGVAVAADDEHPTNTLPHKEHE